MDEEKERKKKERKKKILKYLLSLFTFTQMEKAEGPLRSTYIFSILNQHERKADISKYFDQ